MTFTHLTYRILLAFAPLVLLTGCADDLVAIQGPAQDAPDSEPGVWVSLQLSVPRATRSNPTSQKGEWNEYTIKDLNIFFFHDKTWTEPGSGNKFDPSVKGLDCSDDDAEVYEHRWIEDISELDEIIGPLGAIITDNTPEPDKYDDRLYKYIYKMEEGKIPTVGDFAIVIANYGEEISAEEGSELKLSDITGLTKASSCTGADEEGKWTGSGSPAAHEHFLLSNAYNTQYPGVNYIQEPTGNGSNEPGTRYNPFNTTVHLQRAAARIDLLYNTGDLNAGKTAIIYECTAEKEIETETETGIKKTTVPTAKIELTDIQPINVRQGNTYVFKHLTDWEGTFDESATEPQFGICGKESEYNYVFDPTFRKDNPETKPYYGDTAYGNFHLVDDDDLPFTTSLSTILSPANQSKYPESGYSGAAFITYAEENTMSADRTLPENATGLLLRAIYHPETVYSDVDANGNLIVASDNYSHTGSFWRYMPNLVSANDREGDFDEVTTEDPAASSSKMPSQSLDDTKALYFASKEGAVAYRDSKAHFNEAGTISEEFKGGICYYNVWIEHAGRDTDADPDEDTEVTPMEFGIVRNNLYRLAFTFSGPGTPDVELREPYNVQPRIFVRPWLVREHPEIIL